MCRAYESRYELWATGCEIQAASYEPRSTAASHESRGTSHFLSNFCAPVGEHRHAARRYRGLEGNDVAGFPHLRAYRLAGIDGRGESPLHGHEARGIVAAQRLQYRVAGDA